MPTHAIPSTGIAASELASGLSRLGFTSCLDVVRRGRQAFLERARAIDTPADADTPTDADALYDAALSRASSLAQWHNRLIGRQSPTTRALRKLDAGDARQRTVATIGDGTQYDDWFARAGNYAATDSVASLFSPASYLVDLYRQAKRLHLVSSVFHIDKRRPDLATFVLSQANMDDEVPNLTLVNEILATAVDAKWNLKEEKSPPFELPYDADADLVDEWIRALGTTEASILDALFDDVADAFEPAVSYNDSAPWRVTPELCRATLRWAPARMATLAKGATPWRTPTPDRVTDLTRQTGLSVGQVHDLLAVEPAFGPDGLRTNPKTYGAYFIHDGNNPLPHAAFEIVHDKPGDPGKIVNGGSGNWDRMLWSIAIQRSLGISFEDIDWIGRQIDYDVTDLRAHARLYTAFSQIRDLHGLSANAFAGLVGDLNSYGRPREASFLCTVYSPAILPMLGKKYDFLASAGLAENSPMKCICEALGMLPDQVERCIREGFATTRQVEVNVHLLSGLYRASLIARLVGLTMGETLALWEQMETTLVQQLFERRASNLAERSIRILKCTYTVACWLREQKMDVDTLVRLTARTHATTVDDNILKFVANLHQSAQEGTDAEGHGLSDALTQARMISQLSRHVATHFGMKAEAAAAMLSWVDEVIVEADPDLEGYGSATFWKDAFANPQTKHPLGRDDLPPKLIQYVRVLTQFAEVCCRYGFEEQDIRLIIAPNGYRSPVYKGKTPALSLPTLFHLAWYAAWRDGIKGDISQARLKLVEAVQAKKGEYDVTEFAILNAWPVDDTQHIFTGELESKISTVSHIRRIQARLAQCDLLSIDHPQLTVFESTFALMDSAEPTFTDRGQHAAIARAALNHAPASAQRGVSEACAERLRDARLACYIRLNDWGTLKGRINTPDDLYEYLLLDPLVTAKPTTSRLAEAIASVQLYLHRCREGMEPDVIASALAELKRPGGYFAYWDAYHKRYGTWAGLQRLLRYPASFLDPTLRYIKSEPFRQLEQTLSSARLTAAHADLAFEQFIGGVTSRLDIRIDDAYETEEGANSSIYLLGHDNSVPINYYWRRGDAPYSTAWRWSDWQRIASPAPTKAAAAPSVFLFQGRLRVAWWESRDDSYDGSSPELFKISLAIASLVPGGSWTTHTYDIFRGVIRDFYPTTIVTTTADDSMIVAALHTSDGWDISVIRSDMTEKPDDEWPQPYNFTLTKMNDPHLTYVRRPLRYRELPASGSGNHDVEISSEKVSNWHDDFEHSRIDGYMTLWPPSGLLITLCNFGLPTYLHKALRSGPDHFLAYQTQNAMPAWQTAWKGGPGLYLWELFLHGPLLIASRLIEEQHFDEATVWLERLFAPSGYVDAKGMALADRTGKPLYWNTLPLQDDIAWDSTGQASTDDPDIIAMLDPMHYKLAIFQRWLKLYLDRGDRAYRQQTRDTLTEAKMWYVQASQLLGEQPYFHEVPGSLWPNPTLSRAATSTLGALDVLEGTVEPGEELPADPGPRGQIDLIDGVFLSPLDDDTLQWWPRIAMRLRYLRAGLSLDGRPLVLPLYETPVSPRELQQRRLAAGANGRNLGGPVPAMPVYRFLYALERARSIVREVMQFGMTLQSLMERKDGDAMGALREDQAVAIQALIKDDYLDRQRQLQTTERGLKQSRARAEQRRDHYQSLIDRNLLSEETAAQIIRYALPPLYHLTAGAGAAAAFLDTAPNFYIGGMSFGVGGIKWSAVGNAVVQGMQLEAAGMESVAAGLEQKAAYAVRRDEWNTQKTLAEGDIEQIDIQLEINASEQRQAIDASELLDLQYEHARATRDLLATRFSSQELFGWQASRASTLYYQLYDIALGLCGEAQSAYAYETRQPEGFILPGVWDDLHQGLLAGEGLLLGLQRMEQAFQQQNIRPLEVERTVSLAALADQPLADLIAEVMGADAGEGMSIRDSGALKVEYGKQGLDISFSLKDAGIATDYPASMNLGNARRIKSMALTLPALLGPYEDIRALLGYDGAYAGDMPRGCQAVAISRGLADSGQFVLDFNDARYLPFEGIPVDDPGEIRLSFPDPADRPQREMLLSITDAILHVRYTIQEDATTRRVRA
ncbi:hypothetical protein J2X57_000917 [Luteibacter sp. 1214]|uniref:Tc toxin subunit A-related protein n=1 Tax=Luteibacter sp. 1214 TaxID=2817735 RepID=UPI0028676019|nr:neuraminidase-like domain-containing protein [Luteibacter sp. 1214]MDR6641723.1 hypothetical protein [Luteibacter sp. 1214]